MYLENYLLEFDSIFFNYFINQSLRYFKNLIYFQTEINYLILMAFINNVKIYIIVLENPKFHFLFISNSLITKLSFVIENYC